jgi:hypothetical protein
MDLHCGRSEICTPCVQLPEGDRLTVCVSVADTIGSLSVTNSSLAVVREDLRRSLDFWVDDDDYVTQEMRNSALASTIELDAQDKVIIK